MLIYVEKALKGLILVGLFSSLEASIPLAPDKYIGVTKLDDSNTSVRLSIKDNSNNEEGFYALVYDYETDILSKVLKFNSNNQPYAYVNIIGLTCDKTYKTVVRAYNHEGNSTDSDSKFFNIKSTFNASCPAVEEEHLPLKPGYVGIYNIKKTTARISFEDNSNNETHFKVYTDKGKELSVEGGKISSNDENKHSFQYANLINLTPCRLYTIHVVALNKKGESNVSQSSSFRTIGDDCMHELAKYKKITPTPYTSQRKTTKDGKYSFSLLEGKLHTISTSEKKSIASLDIEEHFFSSEYYRISGMALSEEDKYIYLSYYSRNFFGNLNGGVLKVNIENPHSMNIEGVVIVVDGSMDMVMVAKDNTVYAISDCMWNSLSKRCSIIASPRLYSTGRWNGIDILWNANRNPYILKLTNKLFVLSSPVSVDTQILGDGGYSSNSIVGEYSTPKFLAITLDNKKLFIEESNEDYKKYSVIAIKPTINTSFQSTLNYNEGFVSQDNTEAFVIDEEGELQRISLAENED